MSGRDRDTRASKALRKQRPTPRTLLTAGFASLESHTGQWNGLCPAGRHGLDFNGQDCDLCAKESAP